MEDSEIIEKAKKKFNSTFYNTIYEQLAEKLTIEEAIVLARQDEKRKLIGWHPNENNILTEKQKREVLLTNSIVLKLIDKAKREGFLEAIEKIEKEIESAKKDIIQLRKCDIISEDAFQKQKALLKSIEDNLKKDFEEIKQGEKK